MTLDKLAVIFANSFEGFEKRLTDKMATKDGLKNLETKIDDLDIKVEQVRVDLKSFKQETRENFKEVNKNATDLLKTLEDTTFNHENRIEVLEKA